MLKLKLWVITPTLLPHSQVGLTSAGPCVCTPLPIVLNDYCS